MRFYQADPTLESYWRGVILFGSNFATYKFALAHALYDVERHSTLVLLEDLAVPFSRHICEHLRQAPKQILNEKNPGKFLSACMQFNNGEISPEELRQMTVRYGFSVVLDKFHNVKGGAIEKRFYLKQGGAQKGILLTDEFYQLAESAQFQNLVQETDARWRLVEKAWEMALPPKLLDVHYDAQQEVLFTKLRNDRITLTSCRNSLNGYQKGYCFYCSAPVSLHSEDAQLAEVDHFIPLMTQKALPGINLNGVWNLVLACRECNRGPNGKHAQIPNLELLERLHTRNEYFINSKLPLHEAIENQTGRNEALRKGFLNARWNEAKIGTSQPWKPAANGNIIL